VSPDGREVGLTLAELKPGYVYEFQIDNVTAEEGELLGSPTAFYTANRLLDGQRFTGPYTRPLLLTKAPRLCAVSSSASDRSSRPHPGAAVGGFLADGLEKRSQELGWGQELASGVKPELTSGQERCSVGA
jgi:hypothetical protein